MRLIDTDAIKIPKGFFEKVDNVPKFYDWLDDQPTIEAEPVKIGRWIVHTDKFANGAEYFGYAVCSECGDMFNCMETIGHKPIWGYCPHCGAKMDAEEGEEA